MKVPPLWHGLTGYDAIIRVEDWAWARLDASGQEALVAHELCHGSMSDTRRATRHEARPRGVRLRRPQVRRLAAKPSPSSISQLAMFEPGFGTAGTEGEQTVVAFTAAEKAEDAFPGCTQSRSMQVTTTCPSRRSATTQPPKGSLPALADRNGPDDEPDSDDLLPV